MEVEALNAAGAGVGDRIVLCFDTSPLLKATFFLYVFPILCLLAGAVIGHHLVAPAIHMDPSVISAISGFSFFFAAVLFIKYKGNRMARKDQYRPRITRILKKPYAV